MFSAVTNHASLKDDSRRFEVNTLWKVNTLWNCNKVGLGSVQDKISLNASACHNVMDNSTLPPFWKSLEVPPVLIWFCISAQSSSQLAIYSWKYLLWQKLSDLHIHLKLMNDIWSKFEWRQQVLLYHPTSKITIALLERWLKKKSLLKR